MIVFHFELMNLSGWFFLMWLTIGIILLMKFPIERVGNINPYALIMIVGVSAPILDDVLAFIVGPPFSHHSFFHSLFGPLAMYLCFFFLLNKDFARYAAMGNAIHVIFNFVDSTSLFFPFVFRGIGLSTILGLGDSERIVLIGLEYGFCLMFTTLVIAIKLRAYVRRSSG